MAELIEKIEEKVAGAGLLPSSADKSEEDGVVESESVSPPQPTFGQKAAELARNAALVRVKNLVHEKWAKLFMDKAAQGYFYIVIKLEGEEAEFVGSSGNLRAILEEIRTLDLRVEYDRDLNELFVSWYSSMKSESPSLALLSAEDLAQLSPRSREKAAKQQLKALKNQKKQEEKEDKKKHKDEKKSLKELKKKKDKDK